MKLLIRTLLFGHCVLFWGCHPKSTTELIGPESDAIVIDGSGGTVKVFRLHDSGVREEICDTQATQRFGWSIRRVAINRLRLTTDLGDFDIYKQDGEYLVVPTGTFLSPSRLAAVKLSDEGGAVHALIGEVAPPSTEPTSPPYTDTWVYDQILIPSASVDQLEVVWLGNMVAEVRDSSGRVLGVLRMPDNLPSSAAATGNLGAAGPDASP